MTAALHSIALLAVSFVAQSVEPGPYAGLLHSLIAVAIFGTLGIVLTVLGFKVFDWMLTRVDVERELTEKHNIAVAIVMAAVILGISIVIAASIHG